MFFTAPKNTKHAYQVMVGDINLGTAGWDTADWAGRVLKAALASKDVQLKYTAADIKLVPCYDGASKPWFPPSGIKMVTDEMIAKGIEKATAWGLLAAPDPFAGVEFGQSAEDKLFELLELEEVAEASGRSDKQILMDELGVDAEDAAALLA